MVYLLAGSRWWFQMLEQLRSNRRISTALRWGEGGKVPVTFFVGQILGNETMESWVPINDCSLYYVYISICMYIYIYIYVYNIYIYIHICIQYIYIHIHTYIYIYIYRSMYLPSGNLTYLLKIAMENMEDFTICQANGAANMMFQVESRWHVVESFPKGAFREIQAIRDLTLCRLLIHIYIYIYMIYDI